MGIRDRNFESFVAVHREEHRAARDAVFDWKQRIHEASYERWLAAGGCKSCRGRGYIVVWDTMDSLSGCYAEYGECKNCTPASREHGPSPTPSTKHDSNRGLCGLYTLAFERWATDEEKSLLEKLEAANITAWERVEHVEGMWKDHHAVAYGKKMLVIRSWKSTKRGMKGIVFWVKDNRVGLRLDEEKTPSGMWANVIWANENQLLSVEALEV